MLLHTKSGARIGIFAVLFVTGALAVPVAKADWLGERLHALKAHVRPLAAPAPRARIQRRQATKRTAPRRRDTGLNIGGVSKVTTVIRSNIEQTFTYAASGMGGMETFVATIGSGASHIPRSFGSGVTSPAVVPALAAAIRNARNLHYANARPLPDRIIAVLSRTMPMTALKRARYVQGDLTVSLPNLVNGAQKMFAGNDHAMVVDDVIVFSKMPGATTAADIEWWAHEVHHVYQYQVWGVDRFAANYVKDPTRIENRAHQVAARAVADFRKTAQHQIAVRHAHR